MKASWLAGSPDLQITGAVVGDLQIESIWVGPRNLTMQTKIKIKKCNNLLRLNVGLKMDSLNAHCFDHQAANMTPPLTHCDLPDGMLQTVRAPNKSLRIGA